MQLGMIGLGRMGANMARRLLRNDHECVVYDLDAGAVKQLEQEGATGVASLAALVEGLEVPRAGREGPCSRRRTRWSSSARPGISPARRSSPRCRRW
jgi:hypothetical protein